jgi:hypothetical protein
MEKDKKTKKQNNWNKRMRMWGVEPRQLLYYLIPPTMKAAVDHAPCLLLTFEG